VAARAKAVDASGGLKPGVATITSVSRGNGVALVYFNEPAYKGKGTATYTATSSTGLTGSSGTSPITVSGLTNGVSYTFTITTATNYGVASAVSSTSSAIIPATVPGAPTIGTPSIASATSISVPFTAPNFNGGDTITSYTATSSPGGITQAVAGPGSGSITVSGLTAGTEYTFTVIATNAVGDSVASSDTASIIPRAVPGAPTIGTATKTGKTTATVTFTAPANNGSTITSYTATSSPGGVTGTLAQAASGTISVTGLTAATNYTFTVTATNGVGTGAASSASNQITTDSDIVVPGAPTIGTATDVGTSREYNNGSATVTFSAPASNGGATILDYTVTSSPGGYTVTGASSPLTVTGLASNTNYTFSVTARNSVGSGTASSASSQITATTVPQAPTSLSVATANGSAYNSGQALISFTANGTGGKAVTYAALSSPGGNGSTGTSPITISSLASGTYSFIVTATNANGSATSTFVNATITTKPDAPTIGTATVASGQSYTGAANTGVTFSAPAGNGGLTITGYTVTSSSGNTGSGSSSPIYVADIVGTARTYTVAATNGQGTGSASSASNSVTPVSVPQAPTIGTATAGNLSTSVTFTAGATGGSNITGYTVTSSSGNTNTGSSSPIVVSDANGTARTYTVTATNAQGTSSASSASNSATPTAPAITPTGTVSVSGSLAVNGTLTCSVAGITNGVSYTYQWYWGTGGVAGTVQSGATSSTLTLGAADVPDQYFKCIVVATSSTGNTASFTSNIVGPTFNVPAQVSGVTATVTSSGRAYNNGEIGLSWSAPSANGSAITGYLVEHSSNSGASWSTLSANWTSGTTLGSSPWSVATYYFRVSAINAAGTGASSPLSNAAVVTTVPQAPTIGTATAGNGTVSVSFTAGATGGSSITGFTVTSSSGNTGTGSSSPISVTDTNGTARTYTVTATNANGTSAASAASNSATPSAGVGAAPSGGTVSISTNTGNYSVGSIITYSTSGWSGSPTSYSLRLYNGTSPVITSDPLRASTGSTSGTYTIASGDVPNYFKAFATASNSTGTSTEASSNQVGPATAASGAVPVLISLTGNNSLTLGGTFTWSFSNSPTAYSIFCTGPSGTVFTTSNAFTYSGTTFRPGYDGTGWQGAGTYTMYVTAQNASGTSTTASAAVSMS
jgi:hypothetical protein